jgi:hypothetical protein
MIEPSPTRQVAAKVVHAALEILKKNGGEMRARDVIDQVEHRVGILGT